MRVTVAGGTGFLGRRFVEALTDAGHDVVVMTSSPQRAAGPGYVHGDVLRPETLRPAVAGSDAVVQSLTFPTFPVEKPSRRYTFDEFDGAGTEALVAAAAAEGVSRYVYLSGAGAAAEAARHWFRAKWRGEQAVLGAGLAGVAVRPSWVYGPRDRALNRFVKLARRLPVLPVVGNGKQTLQPVFVDDVAQLVRRAVEPGAPAGVFEIGGPDRMTMDEVLRTMLSVMGRLRPLVHVPGALPKIAGALLRFLPRPPLSPGAVGFITGDAVADVGHLLAAYPMRLTPLEEGLRTYLR